MQKITKLVSLILIIKLSSSIVFSQNYKKGSNLISLGTGLAIYNLTLKEIDTSTTAASFNFPLSYEYAFSNNFGVGFVVQKNNYITGNDSASKTSSAGGWTFGLQSTFYFLRREKVDLHTGIVLGGNTFQISGTDKKITRDLKYNGFAFKILGLCHIYFSEKIGMYTGVNFVNNSLTLSERSEDGVKIEIKDNEEWKEINLSGMELLLGLVVKF